ncbi:MAG TPA: hypothetical protein VN894_00770, partial [Polyangiaceae bacterium]|nr:hypothetical protein [Polyangiaceae bacterium]
MAVLRERVHWAKPRPATERRTASDLSPEEQTNVKAAVRFLAKRPVGPTGREGGRRDDRKRTCR